jgi:hypothetical protein
MEMHALSATLLDRYAYGRGDGDVAPVRGVYVCHAGPQRFGDAGAKPALDTGKEHHEEAAAAAGEAPPPESASRQRQQQQQQQQ